MSELTTREISELRRQLNWLLNHWNFGISSPFYQNFRNDLIKRGVI